MNVTIPAPLQEGATIGLVAPGSPPADGEKIPRGIAWLKEKGFEVVEGNSVYAHRGYLSGTDEVRADDIDAMFADPEIDAVFCTRGGFGCTRLLPLLDYDIIRTNPKPLMGFSDITALHMALFSQAGLASFAGPMVAAEMAAGMTTFTEDAMRKVLQRTESAVEFKLLEYNLTGCSCAGSASGRLTGGNMAVLCSLLGTPYFPDPTGGVLYLEDVGEQVYRIDRMLSQLHNAGVLGAVSGIMLGAFTAIPEANPDRDLRDVLADYLDPLGIPVLDGLPFGHVPDKLTLPVGAVVSFDTEKRVVRMEMGAEV